MHDYAAGKADWMASGRPVEGEEANRLRAATIARREVQTCRPTERVDAARGRHLSEPIVVTDEAGVVVGSIDVDRLREGSGGLAEDLIVPAPTTVRPHADLRSIRDFLVEKGELAVVVTTGRGRLFGVVHRDDAERAIEEEEEADRRAR